MKKKKKNRGKEGGNHRRDGKVYASSSKRSGESVAKIGRRLSGEDEERRLGDNFFKITEYPHKSVVAALVPVNGHHYFLVGVSSSTFGCHFDQGDCSVWRSSDLFKVLVCWLGKYLLVITVSQATLWNSTVGFTGLSG